MTPDDLLAAATSLLQRPDTHITGIWPRAAALLARQALEAAMADLWASQLLPDAEDCDEGGVGDSDVGVL
jgi:hypothetical protein